MDEINLLKEHLDRRLDKIEDKLDNHLERISKNETAIEWIRGHLSIAATLIVAALSGLATAVYNLLTK